jgi:hypothetical protein
MIQTAKLERIMSRMMISDRLWLKNIYESFAEVLLIDEVIDDPSVRTVDDFRSVHRSIKNFIWTGMCGPSPEVFPGLIAAIDAEIDPVLASAKGEVTPSIRRELADRLDMIAWRGLGGDE